MAHFDYSVTTGCGYSSTITVSTDEFLCTGEDYINDPRVYFRYKMREYDDDYSMSQCDTVSGTITGRLGFSMQEIIQRGAFISNPRIYTQNREGSSPASYSAITLVTRDNCSALPANVYCWKDLVKTMDQCILSTNIPIFETNAELTAYKTNGTGIENAINYGTPPPVPVFNPDKLMSAQLNLLRRRLLQLVMPPAYENFFNYTIEEGKAWVTSVKRDEWLAAFGNLDIYIPDTLDGYPVVIVTDMWDW